jgi:hypothetical protein
MPALYVALCRYRRAHLDHQYIDNVMTNQHINSFLVLHWLDEQVHSLLYVCPRSPPIVPGHGNNPQLSPLVTYVPPFSHNRYLSRRFFTPVLDTHTWEPNEPRREGNDSEVGVGRRAGEEGGDVCGTWAGADKHFGSFECEDDVGRSRARSVLDGDMQWERGVEGSKRGEMG